MKTIIEYFKLWLDSSCPDCVAALQNMEELSDAEESGFRSFVLTIRKTNSVPTVHLGIHKKH